MEKVRLINHSKVITDNEVKEMFNVCARELGLKGMTVYVHNTQFHEGYWGHSSTTKSRVDVTTGEQNNNTITYLYLLNRQKQIVINSRDRWMQVQETETHTCFKKKPDYIDKYREAPHLSILFLTREEFVLHLLAHELRHQWQHKKRPMAELTYTVRHLERKSYFRRERDSDTFALRMVRKWRRLHSVDIYPEQPDQLYEQKKRDKT